MGRSVSLLSACFLLLGTLIYAQAERPMLSQKAMVMQRIGVTDVTVSYHRPGIKEREIWGKLVPYDKIWRAGANNATTFETSSDIFINGAELKKGKYAFFAVPSKNKWKVIFNSEWDQWGAFWMDSSKNVLTVEADTRETDKVEWLKYEFSDLSISTGILSLLWDGLALDLNLKVETGKILDQKNYTAAHTAMMQYHGMAKSYLENNIELEAALKAVNKSIQIEENFDNLKTKAEILSALGEFKAAIETGEKALSLAGDSFPDFYVQQFADKILEWKNK